MSLWTGPISPNSARNVPKWAEVQPTKIEPRCYIPRLRTAKQPFPPEWFASANLASMSVSVTTPTTPVFTVTELTTQTSTTSSCMTTYRLHASTVTTSMTLLMSSSTPSTIISTSIKTAPGQSRRWSVGTSHARKMNTCTVHSIVRVVSFQPPLLRCWHL